jgi:hypothetical protein
MSLLAAKVAFDACMAFSVHRHDGRGGLIASRVRSIKLFQVAPSLEQAATTSTD